MSEAYFEELYGSVPFLCCMSSMLKAERRALLEEVHTTLEV